MAQVKDVVCGMMVDSETTELKSEYKDETYYFCGPGCKTAFDISVNLHRSVVFHGFPLDIEATSRFILMPDIGKKRPDRFLALVRTSPEFSPSLRFYS